VVVDGETGALVPASDVDALSARLARLAASPTLGVSWGTEGRRRALARYSAERMVDDYFAVYERIQRL
jgi:mannosyltransferase